MAKTYKRKEYIRKTSATDSESFLFPSVTDMVLMPDGQTTLNDELADMPNKFAKLDANDKIIKTQIPDLSDTYIPVNQKGAANGVATLNQNGVLESTQIPDLSGSYLPIAGGALTGKVTAGGSLDPATPQIRNVYADTADITAGSTALATGLMYLVYE